MYNVEFFFKYVSSQNNTCHIFNKISGVGKQNYITVKKDLSIT
ncbi:hypothetical protein D081_0242 [Anaerovibrio sp. JC8]|nr:hypothetical protein D081_0242 [Anaerovibrio sp. JC8]